LTHLTFLRWWKGVVIFGSGRATITPRTSRVGIGIFWTGNTKCSTAGRIEGVFTALNALIRRTTEIVIILSRNALIAAACPGVAVAVNGTISTHSSFATGAVSVCPTWDTLVVKVAGFVKALSWNTAVAR